VHCLTIINYFICHWLPGLFHFCERRRSQAIQIIIRSASKAWRVISLVDFDDRRPDSSVQCLQTWGLGCESAENRIEGSAHVHELRPMSDNVNERCCQYNTDSFALRSHRSSERLRTCAHGALIVLPSIRLSAVGAVSTDAFRIWRYYRRQVVAQSTSAISRGCLSLVRASAWRPLGNNAPREVLVSGSAWARIVSS